MNNQETDAITTIKVMNLVFVMVGFIGVWQTTHSFPAIFWAFVASLHFQQSKRKIK